jgi:hypothetical protein
MGQRVPGPIGGPQDFTAIDVGTNVRSRSPIPVPYCISRDPSVLQRSRYVLDAWQLAENCYIEAAIIAHTEEDFYELTKGIVPMMLIACSTVLTTTIAGAALGSALAGVGAIPGAAAGYAVGTTLLEILGLAFLAVYLKDRAKDIGAALYSGAETAWKSCGERSNIDAAARSMADSVGLFYAALFQALLMYLGAALANRTLLSSRKALRGSMLFRTCERLEVWITRNFAVLYRKHIGKPPPGVMPPITRSEMDWAKFIGAIQLKPLYNRGVLWSKIGAEKAESLAARRGMTSLEMLLKDNGFMEAFTAVFGGEETAATHQIWKLVSKKYAQSRRGRVIAYVNDAEWAKATRESPSKPIEKLARGESAIEGPIFNDELMKITEVMNQNSNISIVDIRDVSNPDVTIKTMSRMYVLPSEGNAAKYGPN